MNNQILATWRDGELYLHHTVTQNPDAQDETFCSHSHRAYELYYFLGGDAEFAVEGTVYCLVPGTLILMDRRQTHNVILRTGAKTYERIAILLEPEAFPGGFDRLMSIVRDGHCSYTFSDRERDWLDSCLQLAESSVNTPEVKETILAVVAVILAKLSRMTDSDLLTVPSGDELTRAVIRYISAHLTEDWNLDQLAAALYRDKAHLNRRFRSIMGCSIWQYAMQRRILLAQRTLYQTGSICLAFEASGFSEYSTFYRHYRKITGLSPCEDLKRITRSKKGERNE